MDLSRAARSVVVNACRYLGVNRAARRRMRRQLLALAYHGVVAERHEDRLRYANTVSVAEFDSHMAALRRHFHPITMADAIAWHDGLFELPDNAVLVTFDDGYRNNLTLAAPILRTHGVPCVFHVSTGYIGAARMLWTTEVVSMVLGWREASIPLPQGTKAPVPRALEERRRLAHRIKEDCKRIPWERLQPYLEQLRGAGIPLDADQELCRFMTWDEVRQLRGQGFEIGSHTVNHPILSQVAAGQLRFELRESKRAIERETGAPCVAIAYPNGDRQSVSDEAVEAAREEGYRLGFTVIERFTARPVNALAVNRLCIMGHLPVNSFHFRVSGARTPSDAGAPVFRARRATAL